MRLRNYSLCLLSAKSLLAVIVLLAALSGCSSQPRVADSSVRAPAPTRGAAALLQEGRKAAGQQRFDRAIVLFRRIQEAYPEAPERSEATLLLAQALEATGEARLALTEYRRLTAGFSGTPQALVAQSRISQLEQPIESSPAKGLVTDIVGAYVATGGIETLDERDLLRLRQAGGNTLVVKAARNGTRPMSREEHAAGVYFKTDWAPILRDRLGAVTSAAHRHGVQVWAALSVRRMDWIDPALGWADWEYSAEAGQLAPTATLDLLHPAMQEYLLGLLSDLAASGVDGLLLLADPPSGPNEGFSPYARRAYERDMGQAVEPQSLRLGPKPDPLLGYAPEFWRWVGWKQREQVKALDRILRSIRKEYPQLKVAIEVHAEAVSNPRGALAWYGEDFLDLRKYRMDHVVLPLTPSVFTWIRKQPPTAERTHLVFVVESSLERKIAGPLPEGIGLIYKGIWESSVLTKEGR